MDTKLIIADFNIDYPYTYVIVEPDLKDFLVTLHDIQDYDSEAFEREGSYPFNVLYEISDQIEKKIREHGIIIDVKLESSGIKNIGKKGSAPEKGKK